MIVKKEVNYDLECKNPPIIEIGSHELNVESFSLEISLYQNYKKLEFGNGDTVTAALVSGGILIDSDRECTIADNKVTLDITNKKNETATVRAGRMLIELSITTSTNEVYVLPTAFVVRVEKSILDDAVVTENSVGSVADAVKQINDASGEYESLSARLLADYNAITLALASKLNDASGSVKTANLDSGSVTTGKLAGLAVTAAKIANNTITADKLTNELRSQLPTITVWSYETSQANNFTVPTNYEGKLGDIVVVSTGSGSGGRIFMLKQIVSAYGTSTYFWDDVTNLDDNEVTTAKINGGAVTTVKIADGAVTTAKIYSGAVTEAKLSADFKNVTPKIKVWSYETSQTNNFTVPSTYEGKIGDIVVVTTGTGTGGKMFVCARIISAYGSSQYYWEEITLVSRVSALESTVGSIDSVLQAIIDGGASNE